MIFQKKFCLFYKLTLFIFSLSNSIYGIRVANRNKNKEYTPSTIYVVFCLTLMIFNFNFSK